MYWTSIRLKQSTSMYRAKGPVDGTNVPCCEAHIALLLNFIQYTQTKNRQTPGEFVDFLFIFTCVVVAF